MSPADNDDALCGMVRLVACAYEQRCEGQSERCHHIRRSAACMAHEKHLAARSDADRQRWIPIAVSLPVTGNGAARAKVASWSAWIAATSA